MYRSSQRFVIVARKGTVWTEQRVVVAGNAHDRQVVFVGGKERLRNHVARQIPLAVRDRTQHGVFGDGNGLSRHVCRGCRRRSGAVQRVIDLTAVRHGDGNGRSRFYVPTDFLNGGGRSVTNIRVAVGGVFGGGVKIHAFCTIVTRTAAGHTAPLLAGFKRIAQHAARRVEIQRIAESIQRERRTRGDTRRRVAVAGKRIVLARLNGDVFKTIALIFGRFCQTVSVERDRLIGGVAQFHPIGIVGSRYRTHLADHHAGITSVLQFVYRLGTNGVVRFSRGRHGKPNVVIAASPV